MSDIRKGAGDNDAIEARQYASDLILVTFNERVHGRSLWYLYWFVLRVRIGYTTNFGSGYAGLG